MFASHLSIVLQTATCLLFTTMPGDGYKILMHPSNMRSHIINFGEFAAALLDNGHEVHMIIPSNAKVPSSFHANLTTLTYPVSRPDSIMDSDEMASAQFRLFTDGRDSMSEWMEIMNEMNEMVEVNMAIECEELFNNSKFINNLMRNKYDFIMMDLMDTDCMPALVYKLGIPAGTLCLPAFLWFFRVPSLPSINPNIFIESSDRMTFRERFENLRTEYLLESYFKYTSHYVEMYVPEKPAKPSIEIVRELELKFFLHDPILQYPIPLMPNTIEVGDLMQREAKPLPKDFNSLLNKAKHGVIYMSLGSYFKQLPADIENKFCEAFTKLDKNLFVIWKSGTKPKCELPSNILVKSWVPQNDLLAHKNLRIFITHNGWNSYMESAYQATPMIAIPLSLDQPHNAISLESKGLGIKMDIVEFTPEELVENIQEILSNNTYQENANKIANMLRHRGFTARQKINHWIEHVIRFGDQHLRNAGYDLAWYEFLMLDIMGALLLAVAVLCTAAMLCCCMCVRITRYCLKRNPKVKNE